MAGSYKHVIDPDGTLSSNEKVVRMLENGGDVYEAVEEMFGMIWWLALNVNSYENLPVAERVELARKHYKEGVRLAKMHAEKKR